MVITSQVPITLEARDPGSGVAKILYSINDGEWQEYTGPFTLTGDDGRYHISYYGVDNLGNAERATELDFVLDNNPPKTKISFGDPSYMNQAGQWLTSKTPVILDLLSASTYGITKTFYAIDGGAWRRYSGPFHVTGIDGPHQISYYSCNASGTTEEVQTVIVFKDDTPPMTQGKQGAMQPSSPQSSITTPPSSSTAPEVKTQTETSVTTPQPESPAAVPVASQPESQTPSETTPDDTTSDTPIQAQPASTVQTGSTSD